MPSQELPGEDSEADGDMDADGIDGDGPDGPDGEVDLDGAVELEDFDDLEADLEGADLEIADGPDADLAEGDVPKPTWPRTRKATRRALPSS